MIHDVLLEITNKCNLKCGFCYNNSDDKGKEMQLKDAIYILNKLEKVGVKEVFISGGEPFLHTNLLDIIDYSGKMNFKVCIATNGIFINDDICSIISKYNFLGLQISLDGASEIINDHIRGKGHFEKIMNVLEKLKKYKIKNVKIRMTISRYNCHDIGNYIQLASKYHVIPTFSFVSQIGRAKKNRSQYELKPDEKFYILEKLYSELKKHINVFENEKELYKRSIRENIMPITKCQIEEEGIVSPLIKCNGDVQPCQRLYDSEYKIGNIFKEDIMRIFSEDNEKIINIKNEINNRKRVFSKTKCVSCILNNICEKGCICESIDHGGVYEESDECYIRRKIWKKSLIKYFQGEEI